MHSLSTAITPSEPSILQDAQAALAELQRRAPYQATLRHFKYDYLSGP
ncbi:MAG: hypothetical protein ACYC4S_06145 [Rhodoferax sp.]